MLEKFFGVSGAIMVGARVDTNIKMPGKALLPEVELLRD
jgi:hypothetical protein